MPMSDNPAAPAIRSLVAEIVSSYVKKNQIAPADIPTLITIVYQSLLAAGKAPEPEQNRTPAVPIRQSVRPNYSSAWNADDGPRCCASTFGTRTAWAQTSIGPNGRCRRIIHSPRQHIQSDDPASRNNSGWGTEQGATEEAENSEPADPRLNT